MTDVHEILLERQVRMQRIIEDGDITEPRRVPYIIYHGTKFVRQIIDGFEMLPNYKGEIDYEYPTVEEIEKAITYKFDYLERIALVPTKFGYEAHPGWGIKSANLLGIWNIETLNTILDRDDVQAVIWVDSEGNIEFAEAGEFGGTVETNTGL